MTLEIHNAVCLVTSQAIGSKHLCGASASRGRLKSRTEGLNHGVGSMKIVRFVTALAIGVLAGTRGGFPAQGQTAVPGLAENVRMVHGAGAGGRRRGEAITYLAAAGVKANAKQNPLEPR